MPDYTKLRDITNAGHAQLTNLLSANLIDFFNWGLIESKGFVDVTISSPGVAGTGPEYLYPISDKANIQGKIWQSPHANWCYEGNLSANIESSIKPIIVNGVYINGILKASDDATYSHYIDYTNGWIVFNTPIPITSIVQASYSYRYIGFYDENHPWFNTLVFHQFTDEQKAKSDGYLVSLLDENRIQLPAVMVESVTSRTFTPKQIGDSSNFVRQDFLLHIFANNKADRDNIFDILTLQKDKVIQLYNLNTRGQNNNFNLDYKGAFIDDSLSYPELVSADGGYFYNKCWFRDMQGSGVDSRLPFFRGVVRAVLEVDMPGTTNY